VDQEIVDLRSGFTFPVPDEVVSRFNVNNFVSVSLINGQPLPSWITYFPEDGNFVVSPGAPPEEFPLAILISSGREKIRVIVCNSEQSQCNQ